MVGTIDIVKEGKAFEATVYEYFVEKEADWETRQVMKVMQLCHTTFPVRIKESCAGQVSVLKFSFNSVLKSY